MNSSEKFEQIYSKIVEKNSEDLESSRFGAKNETIINIAIISIIIIIGFAFYHFLYKTFYPNDELVRFIISIYIIVSILIYIIAKPKKHNSKVVKYKNDFKTKVIKALLDSFGENLSYYPNQGINSSSYLDAEFEKYDKYSSEDLIQGILKNNCNFSMAEISTVYTTKDSNDNEITQELFCGILSKVETPKPFNACLYLRKDIKDKNLISRAFNIKLPFDKLRVKLDSQEFEKIFDVYCSDKIIAMQLLTADIMELLVEFEKEMNMEYELTLKNNLIYIRFMSGEMFETANIMKYSLDKATLYKYYRMLDFTISLTNKLIKLIQIKEYDD